MAPVKPDVRKLSEEEAELAVRELLSRENRPFNAQLVQDNTAGRVKKAVAARILERMVEAGTVSFKDFGKNRVFYARQMAALQVATAEEAATLSAEIEAAGAALGDATATAKQLQDEAARLRRSLSDSLLQSEIARLEAEKRAAGEAAAAAADLPAAKRLRRSRDPATNPALLFKLQTACAAAEEQARERRRKQWDLVSAVCGEYTPVDTVVARFGLLTEDGVC